MQSMHAHRKKEREEKNEGVTGKTDGADESNLLGQWRIVTKADPREGNGPRRHLSFKKQNV